jgi:hypothetical protein
MSEEDRGVAKPKAVSETDETLGEVLTERTPPANDNMTIRIDKTSDDHAESPGRFELKE